MINHDFAWFIERVLGEKLQPHQLQLLDSLNEPNRNLIAGIGKDPTLVAQAAMSAAVVAGAEVILIHCDGDESEVRREIDRLWVKVATHAPGTLKHYKKTSYGVVPMMATPLTPAGFKYKPYFPGREHEFCGYKSERRLMIVLDAESKPEALFSLLLGGLQSKEEKMLIIGRPGINTGFFYDTTVKMREAVEHSGMWRIIQMEDHHDAK